MRDVYINSYGLSSAFGENLNSHIEQINQNYFVQKAQNYKTTISNEEYSYLYYKSNLSPQDSVKQIPKLPRKTALFIGSSSLGIEMIEKNYKEKQFSHLGQDLLIPVIYKMLNITGQHYIFNTACTSSANALMYASRMIEANIIDDAIVLGIETKNSLSIYGFMSLGILSNTKLAPFDKNRDGIVLGESFGFIHLSSKRSKWRILDGESVNDTSSPTSPSSDGSALSYTISTALKKSKLSTKNVDLIKLHATASYTNDLSENFGIHSVFKDSIPKCVALKGYLGHTLGACGVCELAFLLGSLDKNIIPKSIGFEKKDDTFFIEPTMKNLSWNNEEFILLNHIAFGGNTTTLVIKSENS